MEADYKIGNGNDALHFTNTEIERAYLDVIGSVRILAAENRIVPLKADNNAPYSVENDLDIYRLSAQFTIINRVRILSISDLEGRIKKAVWQLFCHEKNKFVRYVDIRDTYNNISRGDYISNHVEEEKLHREQEKQIKNRKSIKWKGRR